MYFIPSANKGLSKGASYLQLPISFSASRPASGRQHGPFFTFLAMKYTYTSCGLESSTAAIVEAINSDLLDVSNAINLLSVNYHKNHFHPRWTWLKDRKEVL